MQSSGAYSAGEDSVQEHEILSTNLKDNFNTILIRIWDGEKNGQGKSLGHVSLETERIYVSLWPKDDIRLTGAVKGELKSYEGDVDDEGGEKRSADFCYQLLLPNIEELEKAFVAFSSSRSINWSLLGESFSDQENHNCSGLVHYLLKAGGLETLIKPPMFDVEKISISPFIMTGRPIGVAIGTVIATIYYGYKSYTLYLPELRRTLSEHGLVTSPKGVAILMEMAKAEKKQGTNERIFLGERNTIVAREQYIGLRLPHSISECRKLPLLIRESGLALTTILEWIDYSKYAWKKGSASYSDDLFSAILEARLGSTDSKKKAAKRRSAALSAEKYANENYCVYEAYKGRVLSKDNICLTRLVNYLKSAVNLIQALNKTDQKFVIAQCFRLNAFNLRGKYQQYADSISSDVDYLIACLTAEIRHIDKTELNLHYLNEGESDLGASNEEDPSLKEGAAITAHRSSVHNDTSQKFFILPRKTQTHIYSTEIGKKYLALANGGCNPASLETYIFIEDLSLEIISRFNISLRLVFKTFRACLPQALIQNQKLKNLISGLLDQLIRVKKMVYSEQYTVSIPGWLYGTRLSPDIEFLRDVFIRIDGADANHQSWYHPIIFTLSQLIGPTSLGGISNYKRSLQNKGQSSYPVAVYQCYHQVILMVVSHACCNAEKIADLAEEIKHLEGLHVYTNSAALIPDLQKHILELQELVILRKQQYQENFTLLADQEDAVNLGMTIGMK